VAEVTDQEHLLEHQEAQLQVEAEQVHQALHQEHLVQLTVEAVAVAEATGTEQIIQADLEVQV
jgi:hypothetical protein